MDRFGSDFGAFDDRSETENHAVEPGPADDGAYSNPPPSPIGQDERRMQVRAYNHWSALLGRANLPHIEDLEPELLGDFGPYSVLLDFSTGSGTPTIGFIGRELQKECAAYDPIESLTEIPAGSLLSKIADTYLRVVEEQGPVSFEAENANAQGKTIAYRGILLPYSSDQDTIDFVYAVINWKEVADAQTADALLAEIDRAMDYGLTDIPAPAAEPAVRTAEIVPFAAPAPVPVQEPEADLESADAEAGGDPWERDDNILDLRSSLEESPYDFDDLPQPSFGNHPDILAADDAAYTSTGSAVSHDAPQHEKVDEPMAYDTSDAAPESPKRTRQTDALGNPIGGAPADDFSGDSIGAGITSAADYGLPEWDEDEEEEDVDELVNPLANIDLNSRLLALVNSGTRSKKTVDLATLSEAQTHEEDEGPAFDRSLFRPKAPSVDSLLTPEPYDEEDEDEDAYYFSDAEEELEEDVVLETAFEDAPAADTAEPQDFSEDVELVLSSHEEVEDPVEEPLALDSGHDAFAVDAGDHTPVEVESLEGADETTAVVPAEVEADDTVIELIEEFPEEAAEETVEEPFELAVEFVAEEAPVELTEVAEFEEPAELADVLELAEVLEEETHAESLPEVVEVVAAEPAATETGLTGLLAAVQELSEAARTTEDTERRALYEAVARAFDVSIKAVVASAKPSRDVIEDFPLDAIPGNGPGLALVMVRRHANGDTEVLGEVPHDSDLMENAQRRIASR